MNICLFTEEEILKPLSKKDERAQHIIKILHKQEGNTFSAGIIGGMAGTALITKIDDSPDGFLHFSFTPQSDGKNLFPLKMIIGFPRPIQLKRLLRDMAGLGVSEVHLCGTELGEKSYLSSDLATTDAGTKMLLDGTVQAGSTHVPKLVIHKNLKECVSSMLIFNSDISLIKITLDNIAPQKSLTEYLAENSESLLQNNSCVIAAIGSERGWTDNERNLLSQNGFVPLSMGKRILRTETAGTVAASIILSQMGKLD